MKKHVQIKPSKLAGVAQMIWGIVFTIIGLTVAIPMMSNGGPVWFGILWTGAAAISAVIGAINAFSDKGIPTEEIVSDWSEKQDMTADVRVGRSEEAARSLDLGLDGTTMESWQ